MFRVMYVLGNDRYETEESTAATKTEALRKFRELGHRLVMMYNATLWVEDDKGKIIILREIKGN